jgi:hypothetical protein
VRRLTQQPNQQTRCTVIIQIEPHARLREFASSAFDGLGRGWC